MNLADYVSSHTIRGECNCGLCMDRGDKPDPVHAVDNGFFKVAQTGRPDLETFVRLSKEWPGEFEVVVNPFDGKEHGFIELGAWLGDQGLALRYMALGHILKAFRLITPRTIFGADASEDLVRQLAGSGLVTIIKP